MPWLSECLTSMAETCFARRQRESAGPLPRANSLSSLTMHGDARNAFTLHPDPTHKKQAFVAVVLKPGEGGDG